MEFFLQQPQNINKNANSTNTHRKVRLKRYRPCSSATYRLGLGLFCAFIYFNLIGLVHCNRPPRFLIDGQSEIVLRLKEGPETPVGKSNFLGFSSL